MNSLLFSISKFFKNKNTVTIIGTIAIIAILYVGYTLQLKNATELVTVPVAKVTIDQKTKITSAMVDLVEVPRFLIKSNVITLRSLIEGKYTNYNVIIPAGSMFFSGESVLLDTLPDQAFASLKEGEIPFNFKVTLESTYGNSIYPDSIVDIYMKATDASGTVMVGRLLKDVRVLAVKDSSGNDVFESALETRTPSTFIFGLDSDTHLLMRKATYLDQYGVELFPVPRGGSLTDAQKDALTTVVSTSYLKEFIIANTVKITEDDLLEAEQEETDTTPVVQNAN